MDTSSQNLNVFTAHLEKCLLKMDMDLKPDQILQMTLYAEQLMLWNRRINLTAIRKPELIAEKHFADCMTAALTIEPFQTILDIGTGAGFPGIVIKIMYPDKEVVLVDASRKKVNFLKQVIRTLKLDEICALHQRIEDLSTEAQYTNAFDAVTCRAYTQLDGFISQAQAFLQPTGHLLAMKGPAVDEEIGTCDLSRFNYQVHSYTLPFEQSRRSIVDLWPKA